MAVLCSLDNAADGGSFSVAATAGKSSMGHSTSLLHTGSIQK